MVDLEPSQSVTETKTIKLRSLDRYGVACVSNCFSRNNFREFKWTCSCKKVLFWWFHYQIFPYWSLWDEEGTGFVHLMLIGTRTAKPFGFIPNSSNISQKILEIRKIEIFCSLNRWFFPSQDVLKERYHQLWYPWQIPGQCTYHPRLNGKYTFSTGSNRITDMYFCDICKCKKHQFFPLSPEKNGSYTHLPHIELRLNQLTASGLLGLLRWISTRTLGASSMRCRRFVNLGSLPRRELDIENDGHES